MMRCGRAALMRSEMIGLLAKSIRESGKSQRRIAIECGLDPSYITHLLAGRREPSLRVMVQLFDACGQRLCVSTREAR